MKRRDFITLLGGATASVGCPLVTWAQQAEIRRIGVLISATEDDSQMQSHISAFHQGLRELGWVEGRNVHIDARFPANDPDRLRSFAAELVGLKPDVLLASGPTTVLALQRVAGAAPIVFTQVNDPVGAGVATLAHPGGNVTGFTPAEFSIGGKLLEVLKEFAPDTAQVGVLLDTGLTDQTGMWSAMEMAAPIAGVRVQQLGAPEGPAIERAIGAFASGSNGGLIVLANRTTIAYRKLIIELAAKYRLPSIYSYRYFAGDGGLASYGADLTGLYRRAASYVDRILKVMRSRAGIDPDRPTKLVSRLIAAIVLLSVCPASGVAQFAGGGPELVVQTAHTEFVRAAAFSADGRFLATGGTDDAVKIWETASGFAVRSLTGFSNQVNALAFSRDGSRLATASWLENTVEFFEVATGRHQSTLDLKKEANGCADSALAIAFSHDDRLFAVAGSGGCVVLWDRSSGGVRPLVGHKGRVYRVAFSDDDRSLASLAEDNNVIIWDVAGATATRTVSLPPHPSATNVFALSPAPGGGWLAAGAYGSKAIALWQIDRAYAVRASRLDGHKDLLTSLAFSPDGRWLASGAQDTTARIWEVATGHQRFVLEGHSNEIEGLAFNRDATRLATASWDGQVKLWDLGSGREVRTLGGAAFNVHAVAYAPDGRWLASASQDGTIKLWDLDNGVLAGLLRGPGLSVENLAFRPDGRRLAATRADGTIAVWDVPEWRLRYSLPGHRNVQRMPFPSAALAFSADGKWLAAADGVQDEKNHVDRADRTLKIRDAESGRELLTLVGHSHIIDAVAISPDRKWIATACRDHSVRIWDAATGRAVHVLNKHVEFIGTLAFSADGALLAVGSKWRREITLVDVASGRDVRTLEHGAGIHSLVFIHGGRWLASEAGDDTVKIWEVASGNLLRTIQLTDGAQTIAFSPDERWIASATRDGTTRIFDVASGEERVALASFYPGSDWLAIAPDGLFDGTADAMQQVAWRKAESNDTSSLDAFFTDFFHPGLLAEISAGRRPKARIDLATSLQVPGLRTMLRNKLAHIETHGDHVVVCFEQKPGAVLNIGPADQRVVFPAVDGYEPGTTTTCKFEKRLPTAIGNAGTIEQMQGAERATTPWDGQTSGAGDATLHVLTVAVSGYPPTSGFEPLPYAVRSAKAIEAFFRDQQANRKLYAAVRAWDGLYDADATRANLRKRLSDMADKMTEKDVVLIYMAGHGKVTSGEEMFYFVPSDGRDGDLRDTSVSAAMLAEGLRNLPARRVVLILDSCQSGGAIESLAKIASVKALAEERRVRQGQPAGRDVGIGVHVIAATLPLAYAVGLTEGQSVLAETILRVLHRAGGPLTAGGLANDLKSELPAASERAIHGFRQVPLAESVGLDFPLAAR